MVVSGKMFPHGWPGVIAYLYTNGVTTIRMSRSGLVTSTTGRLENHHGAQIRRDRSAMCNYY
jgi:hypothetical protein